MRINRERRPSIAMRLLVQMLDFDHFVYGWEAICTRNLHTHTHKHTHADLNICWSGKRQTHHIAKSLSRESQFSQWLASLKTLGARAKDSDAERDGRKCTKMFWRGESNKQFIISGPSDVLHVSNCLSVRVYVCVCERERARAISQFYCCSNKTISVVPTLYISPQTLIDLSAYMATRPQQRAPTTIASMKRWRNGHNVKMK